MSPKKRPAKKAQAKLTSTPKHEESVMVFEGVPTFATLGPARFQAVCTKGDFVGDLRNTREEAATDAIAHQDDNGNASHEVRVIAQQ